MMYSGGMVFVSFKRIVVAVHVSRCSGVVIASLNMPSMLFISSLLVVQPWHAYVIMGIIMT